MCRNCSIKGHFEKVCVKGKHSTHLVNVPEASNNSTSSEPDYYNEHERSQCMLTWLVYRMTGININILIQFLISTSLEKVRNLVESSKFPTVLLKADTGADVNLMNSKTFDSLFNRKGARIYFIENEGIWKQQCSGSTWKVPCIPQMEGKNLQTTFLHYKCK